MHAVAAELDPARPDEVVAAGGRCSILPELRAVIDATPSTHMTYFVTAFGKPFSVAGFGNKFREWCNEAGLPHCAAHGIRKYDATTAAENGATEHQLMGMFGWDDPKQAATYTRKARSAKCPTCELECPTAQKKRGKTTTYGVEK